MKLKYYLRGLGVGVICTAIVMGIALSGNKKETLTDAEIIERARLLGMVMEEEKTGSDKKDSEQKEAGKEQTSGQNRASVTPEKQEEESQEDNSLEESGEKMKKLMIRQTMKSRTSSRTVLSQILEM